MILHPSTQTDRGTQWHLCIHTSRGHSCDVRKPGKHASMDAHVHIHANANTSMHTGGVHRRVKRATQACDGTYTQAGVKTYTHVQTHKESMQATGTNTLTGEEVPGAHKTTRVWHQRK
jgi:hypothetical protein